MTVFESNMVFVFTFAGTKMTFSNDLFFLYKHMTVNFENSKSKLK